MEGFDDDSNYIRQRAFDQRALTEDGSPDEPPPGRVFWPQPVLAAEYTEAVVVVADVLDADEAPTTAVAEVGLTLGADHVITPRAALDEHL